MSTAATADYVIRGGIEGRERLRILARVMHPNTSSFLTHIGVREGMTCLDVGCGGGDVTRELARRVGPSGWAFGVDIDEVKISLARQETDQQGIHNVEYHVLDIRSEDFPAKFDLIYARFLLTHLVDPASILDAFKRQLQLGGMVAVEDIDFSGYFSYPDCPAFRRYRELYTDVVRERGGDPNIGPRLPLMLMDAGFESVGVSIVQPVGTQGDVKFINPITLENIADSILHDGLASRAEIDSLVQDLYDFAANPHTLAGLPRIVQAVGRQP